MTPDALIIGGGPTGMILANDLLRGRVPCRLVDKLATPDPSSKAFTVHARTLEMLEQIGVAHRFMEIGEPCPAITFNFKDLEDTARLDFSRLDNTRYPFILKLGQAHTESILREHLENTYSVTTEWNTEIVGLRHEDERFGAVLKHLDDVGREEIVWPRWLIACDGAHSAVRKALGLAFTSRAYEDMILQWMDTELSGYRGDDACINYYMSAEEFFLVTKLPGRYHRLYVSDKGAAADPNLTPRQAFQSVCDRFLEGVTIAEPVQATKWIIRTNLAQAYRKDNIFLCGDATHIHSPSGGQGMNACMRDAFNLGWKLAMYARGEAPLSILESYERERRPIAEQVTAGAHAMHQIQMAHGTAVEDRLRLTRNAGWHNEAIARISGLSHHYRYVAHSDDGLSGMAGPQPGDRAPDAIVARTPQRRLFDILRHPRFTLLMIPAEESFQEDEACGRLADELTVHYAATIKIVVLISAQAAKRRALGLSCIDETGDASRCYGPTGIDRLYAIRPDGFVGFCGRLADRERLTAWLDRWMVAQPGPDQARRN
jgi:2-polyprenyl-6-methoxyphenol hydroxylase-like FAD-dependent oxidoreductase